MGRVLHGDSQRGAGRGDDRFGEFVGGLVCQDALVGPETQDGVTSRAV